MHLNHFFLSSSLLWAVRLAQPAAAFSLLNVFNTLTNPERVPGGWRDSETTSGPAPPPSGANKEKRQIVDTVNYNPNGSAFLWLLEDDYSGKNFFDRWDFFDQADFTHGMVDYVNRDTAFKDGLAYVRDDGNVVMKADDKTQLQRGQHRKSVRISSKKRYESGSLFILDMDRAPWGCAVWPAWWTVGPDWPAGGEIDILEGVHDSEHNQIAWHTGPGCWVDGNRTSDFTGTVKQLNCDKDVASNAGCGVVEWSRASYGPYFTEQGGGILAMKWDENDISVWSFFRAAIPQDILQGTPNPSKWGKPSARLHNNTCEIRKYFRGHVIVINITFCGDWAGATYNFTNCPGSCADRMMDPGNFVNSSWSIRTLKVYKKTLLVGNSTTASSATAPDVTGMGWTWILWSIGMASLMSFGLL